MRIFKHKNPNQCLHAHISIFSVEMQKTTAIVRIFIYITKCEGVLCLGFSLSQYTTCTDTLVDMVDSRPSKQLNHNLFFFFITSIFSILQLHLSYMAHRCFLCSFPDTWPMSSLFNVKVQCVACQCQFLFKYKDILTFSYFIFSLHFLPDREKKNKQAQFKLSSPLCNVKFELTVLLFFCFLFFYTKSLKSSNIIYIILFLKNIFLICLFNIMFYITFWYNISEICMFAVWYIFV